MRRRSFSGGSDKITRCHNLLTQHIDCVHLAIDGFSALEFAFDSLGLSSSCTCTVFALMIECHFICIGSC